MDDVRKLIDQIVDGNASDSQESFNDIMSTRIMNRLDDMKKEVGASMFASTQETVEGTQE